MRCRPFVEKCHSQEKNQPVPPCVSSYVSFGPGYIQTLSWPLIWNCEQQLLVCCCLPILILSHKHRLPSEKITSTPSLHFMVNTWNVHSQYTVQLTVGDLSVNGRWPGSLARDLEFHNQRAIIHYEDWMQGSGWRVASDQTKCSACNASNDTCLQQSTPHNFPDSHFLGT